MEIKSVTQKTASSLIQKLTDLMESYISRHGADAEKNMSHEDITWLRNEAIRGFAHLWDNSELSPYLFEDLAATMEQLEAFTDPLQAYDLAGNTSFYIQSFSLAMNEPDILEMMCGGITSVEELSLWKGMALSMASDDDRKNADSDETVQPITLEMIKSWADRHHIRLDISCMRDTYTDRYELDTDLVSALQEKGYFAFGEQGVSPDEYLPGVIRGYLQLVDDATIKLESVVSHDGWVTALVVITLNQMQYEFKIEEINQSDWVPEDLSNKLYQFSIQHLDKVLYTVFGEDPFVVLYFDKAAAEELGSLRGLLLG